MHIAIVGGGVIGVTTAYFLSRDGHSVTVIDRNAEVASETSFANGGLITPSQSDPWNAPGIFGKLIHWLGREDSPLLLRPAAIPVMGGWLWRFIRASRAAGFNRSMQANARLGVYSGRMLAQLREDAGIDYSETLAGTIKIFYSDADLEESARLSELVSGMGVDYRVMTGAEAAALEPSLAPISASLAGAILYPHDECGDCAKFTRGLAERARAGGVSFRMGVRVRGFRTAGDRIEAIETDAGPVSADRYVLAAGSYSPLLVKRLGIKLPVRPVKGYSLTVPSGQWHRPPSIPLVDFTRKAVVTPLGDRIRIAGTAELCGYNLTLDRRLSTRLFRRAMEMFPEENPDMGELTHWTGLRPVTSDGPPVLGASPYRNLYFNTGQGPLGWTLSAGSARVVADLVEDRQPAIDLDGLTFSRFAGR